MTDILLFLWTSELLLQLDSSTVLTITRISYSTSSTTTTTLRLLDPGSLSVFLLSICYLPCALNWYDSRMMYDNVYSISFLNPLKYFSRKSLWAGTWSCEEASWSSGCMAKVRFCCCIPSKSKSAASTTSGRRDVPALPALPAPASPVRVTLYNAPVSRANSPRSSLQTSTPTRTQSPSIRSLGQRSVVKQRLAQLEQWNGLTPKKARNLGWLRLAPWTAIDVRIPHWHLPLHNLRRCLVKGPTSLLRVIQSPTPMEMLAESHQPSKHLQYQNLMFAHGLLQPHCSRHKKLVRNWNCYRHRISRIDSNTLFLFDCQITTISLCTNLLSQHYLQAFGYRLQKYEKACRYACHDLFIDK